jgi:hypothetical protein
VEEDIGQLQMREQNFLKDTQENFQQPDKGEVIAYQAGGFLKVRHPCKDKSTLIFLGFEKVFNGEMFHPIWKAIKFVFQIIMK